MKRIKFYVIHCTAEERDRGKEHWESFNKKEDALKRADEINYSNLEFIAIEKHHEIYKRNEWLPDWELGQKQFERIDY